jgi:hypothetical protein
MMYREYKMKNRGTGRTTRSLNRAIKTANDGTKVIFIVADEKHKRHVNCMMKDSEYVDKLKGEVDVKTIYELRGLRAYGKAVVDHYTWENARDSESKLGELRRFLDMLDMLEKKNE